MTPGSRVAPEQIDDVGPSSGAAHGEARSSIDAGRALPDRVDVVVVGAGLSGLTCARALASSGVDVAVLEARDRVGGRTLSRRLGDGVFDLGGQWLGARQPRLERLTAELGLATFPTFHAGKKVLELNGARSTYDGSIPRLAPWKLVELQRSLMMLDRRLKGVRLDDPMRSAEATGLDGATLAEWSQRKVYSASVRALLDASARVVFGAESRDISLLYFLWYLRSGGGLMSLVEIEGGAQQTRFVQGAQALSTGLAGRLEGRVFLGAPVDRVTQGDDGVTLRTPRGSVRARRAVIAVPPALAGRIAYEPALPAARDLLTQRFAMGATVKCLALYDRAFWRERGLSGEAVFGDGSVTVAFDNTSHDGKQPCLLAFVVGDAARVWHRRDEGERRRDVLDALARCFGDEARSPGLFVEQDWSSEPWSRGCPVGVMPPGGLTTAGDALRAPVGRLHWAGTETALEWSGYLEGAIEAGERAAAEVARGLS